MHVTEPARPAGKAPGAAFPCQQVGDYAITAISDGYLTANLELLSNIAPLDAARMQADAGVTEAAAIHINCYVVHGRGRTILIDAGAGGIKQWGGHLQQNLRLAGIEPGQIDTILLTHAHPDHIGGLLDSTGAIAFANAELLVHQHDVGFWQDDGQLARASARAQGNFHIARRVFEGYHTRLRTFAAGEVLPGISAVPLPGHTPGHSGFRFDAGPTSLLVWGDIVHFPQIQMARPDVSIAFDQDPLLSAHTRTRLLDCASAERLLIAGMHLGELGFARIERRSEGYAVVYEA